MGKELQGKRVVLLGGTSGIGLATAQAASHESATVVVVSSRQARVDEAIAKLPPGTEGYAADLSSDAAIRDLFECVGAFDHLVYTAGDSLKVAPLDAITAEQARAAFEIRYFGALAAAKYGSRRIRPGGSITLTTGNAGPRPQKGWTVITSICTAMEGLTRALAVELAPIRVNAVMAGIVRTNLWSPMPDADRDALFDQVARALPVGRVGEPADIAQAYLYLMREGYSTGTVLLVDGGGVLV
jgi:NAD(P)-dependent dehydrogenase (short-subunit alcohol dehydrogenase family)